MSDQFRHEFTKYKDIINREANGDKKCNETITQNLTQLYDTIYDKIGRNGINSLPIYERFENMSIPYADIDIIAHGVVHELDTPIHHADIVDRDPVESLSAEYNATYMRKCYTFFNIEDMEAIGSDSSDLGVNDDMSGDNAVTNGSVVAKDSTGSQEMAKRMKTSILDSQTIPSSESSFEFSKDSFDRFGDDLCRLLLSYLPFEEHFRRECLSKQFQRCLHIPIKVLTITDTLFAKMSAKCGSFGSDVLTDILKKCPNIQTINCYDISYKRQILEAIDGLSDDYCRRLTRIDFSFAFISDCVTNWVQKFAPKLQNLGVNASNSQCLQYCHHLRHLRVQSLTDVFTPDNRLTAQKLVSIEFIITDDFSNEMFTTFVANNKSLKSLYVMCWPTLSMGTVIGFMAQISGLPQLQRLRLNFLGAKPYSLYDSLYTIGTNCRQLRRFSLIFKSNSSKLNVDVMNAMKFMPRLHRLDLLLWLTPDAEVVTDFCIFHAINGCKRFTHLTLRLWRIRDTLFAGIQTNHRKLQVLSINTTDEDNKYNESDFETFIMRSSAKLSAFTVRQRGRPVIHFSDQQIYELRHN
ncbi:unnamed protein product [Oppiella nova]|uniref:F-box domain-containing protein n=1 Tax=Oppiella nova TaxID=334625 RepID=A0A7R9MA20_9ACAR|nr:unnamed protein product [Oppiella nova]CAG2173585.1 unnamed protein product [Oppiella nova]